MRHQNHDFPAIHSSQAVDRRLLASLILVLLVTLACLTSGGASSAVSFDALTADPTMPSDMDLPAPLTIPGDSVPNSRYDIGQPVLTEIYVSPDGDDTHDGLTVSRPLRTLTVAWAKIPAGAMLTGTGYRINLLPGTYQCEPAEPDDCQNSFGGRHGTYQFPVILRAYQGAGSAIIRGGFDLDDISYLYLIDLAFVGGTPLPTNQSGNNLLHLANADHVLLRSVTLNGPDCNSDACNNLQEVMKVNQAQYLYVEDSLVSGAWHTAIDFFSVQYGHVLNSRAHTAGQWCLYVKGGTAYIRVDGNEFHDCQLGFQAGQSSNLTTMRHPWMHYEAYDVKFVNNVLHDIPGVGMSVSGGYNILFAYNTLYLVGTATDPGYPLVQAVQGERGCSATDEIPNPVPACQNLTSQGAWGPRILTDNLPAIPNHNVYIYNNLIYNPAPSQTLYTHLYVPAPVALPAGFQNLPTSVAADRNLVIAGNLIWNGPAGHPLGVDDTTGCASSNPTCNPAQLVAGNAINSMEPQLVDPSSNNYRPISGSNVYGATTYVLPDFTWEVFAPTVPTGILTNTVSYDRDGHLRSSGAPPGAYATSEPAFGHKLYLPISFAAYRSAARRLGFSPAAAREKSGS